MKPFSSSNQRHLYLFPVAIRIYFALISFHQAVLRMNLFHSLWILATLSCNNSDHDSLACSRKLSISAVPEI